MSPHLTGARVVPIDAAALEPDAVTLDALARLALAARRSGSRIALRGVSPELADLIELAGLSEALGIEPVRPGSTQPRC